METQNWFSKHIRLLLILLFIFLILIIPLILIIVKKNNSGAQGTLNKTGSSEAVSPTVTPTLDKDSFFDLQAELGKVTYKKGETVTLYVLAESGGRNIVAYDVVVWFDSTAFQVKTATTLDGNYRLSTLARKDVMTLTGSRLPNSQVNTPLTKDRPLIRLRFTALKPGSYRFQIYPTLERDKSQMVDVQSTSFLPRVGYKDITVE